MAPRMGMWRVPIIEAGREGVVEELLVPEALKQKIREDESFQHEHQQY